MSVSPPKVTPPEIWGKSWRHFRVLGSHSPEAFTQKLAQVPKGQPHVLGNAAGVFIDILRATSTLVAIAAAGCEGIYVDRKPKDRVFQFVPPMSDGTWVYGGEQYGRPIRGETADGIAVDGIIDNSPVSVRRAMFDGLRLRFYSTNGAHALGVMGLAKFARVHAMTFANVGATATAVLARAPSRIWLVCGGFYGCASLEDAVAAGLLIEQLVLRGYTRSEELDDEAEIMLVLARQYREGSGGFGMERLMQTLETKQVARLIGEFGHLSDVRACVVGDGLQPGLWDAMTPVSLAASDSAVPYLTTDGATGLT